MKIFSSSLLPDEGANYQLWTGKLTLLCSVWPHQTQKTNIYSWVYLQWVYQCLRYRWDWLQQRPKSFAFLQHVQNKATLEMSRIFVTYLMWIGPFLKGVPSVALTGFLSSLCLSVLLSGQQCGEVWQIKLAGSCCSYDVIYSWGVGGVVEYYCKGREKEEEKTEVNRFNRWWHEAVNVWDY